MIKYAIIGYGNAGLAHARVVRRLQERDVALSMICDVDEARNLQAETAFRVTTVTDYHDLLAQRPDIVSVCTPHDTHKEITVAALSQGIHVLCEKPLATTISDADEMIAAAQDNGVTLGTIFQHRYELANDTLKKEVRSGRLGRILSCSVNVKWCKDEAYYRSWHGSMRKSGGGVVMTQAIHMIDLARWLNSGIEAVTAHATTSRPYIDVEDNAVAIVEYGNGAIGCIDCSTSANPGLGTTIEIIGEKGTVRLHEGRIVTWGTKDSDEIAALNSRIKKLDDETWGKKYFGYGHIFQIEDFVGSVIQRTAPAVTGEEGKKTLEVILAIQKSVQTGRKVVLS